MQAEKIQLLELVNQAEDPDLIKELLSLVKAHNAGEDFWDTLHDEVKNNVEEAIIELDNGKGLSHAEMKKKHEKWLKK